MKNLLLIGAFLIIMGVLFFIFGWKEQGLAAASSKEPEEIALKNLIARGPDGNPNILLKDHVLCDNFVFKTRNGVWTSAWVPMVPRESVGPGQATGGRPAAVQAIMFSTNARDQADLYNRCGQQRVRCLVTNRITSLGSKERDMLQQSYPGTDFDRCLIVQEGREPAGAAKVFLMIGGGGVATLVGLGMVGFGLYQWRAQQSAPRKRRRRPRDDDEDEDDEPRPIKRRRPRADEDEDDQEERPRARRRVERDDDEEEERPRRPQGRPQRRVERDDVDDEDDRPRRPRRRD
ncbi:MAG: hypothetical protein L0Y71_20585 [Gemmataceae bacterium]|nr:hypothetical protein [Gemmataceae bacterium]